MKFLTFLTLVLIAASGCRHMNNTEKGAAIGSGMGAIAGTAIGAATGNPRTGAVVGALGGALVGGSVGNAEDEREKDAAIAQASLQTPAPSARLGLSEVVRLSQQGIDSEVIVNQIRSTGSTFTLSTGDLEYLNQQGVSPRVVRAMQESQNRPLSGGRPVIVREAPVYIERHCHPGWGPCWGPPRPAFGFHYVHVR